MANLSNINNKFLVTTGGDVAIGVTSPGEKLDVGGNIRVRGVSATKQGVIHNSGSYFSLVSTGDTSDTTGARIWLGNNSSANAYYQNASSHYFRDLSSSIKMILNSSGNIGIGTASPGTLHGVTYGTTRLHVDGGTDRGQMIIEGDSFAGIVLSDNGTTANERVFATSVDDGKYTIKPLNDNGTSTAGGVAVAVLHGGEVGIGTTSPIGKTDIFVGASGYTNNVTTLPVGTWSFANGSGSNSYPSLVSKSNATGAGMTLVAATDDGAPNGMDFNIRKGDNTDFSTLTTSGFTFSRFGTILTTILRNGNVGIGTTLPSVGLQLGNSTLGETKTAIFNSEGGGEVGLTIQSRTNRAKLRVADNDSNAYVVAEAGKAFFGTSANGDTTNITVLTSGNVGIGTTSPVGKFQVSLPTYTNEDTNSQQAIFGVDSGYGVRIGYNETDNKGYINVLQPGVAWGSLILQEEIGKVGIGTDSPQRPLHVNGTEGVARFTSTASGNNGFEVGIGVSSQAFLWLAENSHMEFATNNIERMRIDQNGQMTYQGAEPGTTGIRFQGSGTCNGYAGSLQSFYAMDVMRDQGSGKAMNVQGTIDIAAGYGIGFGAASGSGATSTLLDDYEEGTWTPTVKGDITAGTATYGAQGGSYTKIGNKVTCWFSILNFSQSGAVGAFTVAGLPFTCITTSAVRGCFGGNLRFYNMDFPNGFDVPSTNLDDNAVQFYILWSRDNSTWINQPVKNGGNQYIEGYVTYTTA
jgi:hypothetical protein